LPNLHVCKLLVPDSGLRAGAYVTFEFARAFFAGDIRGQEHRKKLAAKRSRIFGVQPVLPI
jgi:hypothetical protein